jgi:hypothetical protein
VHFRFSEPYIYPILNWIGNPLKTTIVMTGMIISGAMIHCMIHLAYLARVQLHHILVKKKSCQPIKSIEETIVSLI